jgi:hypothetical protein
LDDDVCLFEQMSRFYEEYGRQIPRALRDIGIYIRRHPDEFVRLVDENTSP